MKNTSSSQFQKGNTRGRGRPQGCRNKATIALQELLDGHGESITKKCALMALQGDPGAMRLCMERLIPPRKDHAVSFHLPPVTTAAEVAGAVSLILTEVSRGQLTPEEGDLIANILEGRRRVIETAEHEARILALESDPDQRSNSRIRVVGGE